MEKYFIHTFEVPDVNEVVPFKIHLPYDVEEITGIAVTENSPQDREVSENPFPPKYSNYNRSIPVGNLVLRERGAHHSFYFTQLIRNDNSLRYGDFDRLNFYQATEATLPDYLEHDWPLAGTVNEFQSVSLIPTSFMLLGYYVDKMGAAFWDEYFVSIYFRYKPKKQKHAC